MKNNMIFLIIILVVILLIVLGLTNFSNKDKKTSSKSVKQSERITSVDDFYKKDITKNKLGANYSIDEAIRDNCFVLTKAKVYNDSLYEDFINNYNNKQTSFIRIVKDYNNLLIVDDVLYNKDDNLLYLVSFNFQDNKKLDLLKFENIGTYKYDKNEYLVLFNKEITDENFKSENVFILATIN